MPKYALIKNKRSGKVLGAVQLKKGVTKSQVQKVMRKGLAKGLSYRIVTQSQLEKIALASRPRRKISAKKRKVKRKSSTRNRGVRKKKRKVKRKRRKGSKRVKRSNSKKTSSSRRVNRRKKSKYSLLL